MTRTKWLHPLEVAVATHAHVDSAHAIVVKQQVLDAPIAKHRPELATCAGQLLYRCGRSGEVLARCPLRDVVVLPRTLYGHGQQAGRRLAGRHAIQPQAKPPVYDSRILRPGQQVEGQAPPLTVRVVDLESAACRHRALRIRPLVALHAGSTRGTALHVRCNALHKYGANRGPEGPTEATQGHVREVPQPHSQSGITALQSGGGGIRTLEAPYDA